MRSPALEMRKEEGTLGYGHEDEAVTKLSQRGRGEVTWAEIDVALLLGILDMLTL